MSEQLHTCSYSCQRLGCVLTQRSELLQRCEQQAAEIERLRALLADNSYASSFQTMGQYRTALLAALAEGK